MLRAPLPDELARTFTVREARERGVAHRRTTASDLAAPFHGVRVPAELADDDLTQLHALAKVTPDAAVSHQSAARLWRLPLPHRLSNLRPIHLVMPAGTHRVQRPHVVGHECDRTVVVHSVGVRVTDLGDTWCDLATSLTFTQLVQTGDAILNREGWDLDRLSACIRAARGRRGVRALRAALPMLRPGSLSPRESECRLLFDSWGLPEPELNVDLSDASGWLACVDFLWPEHRVVAEYYGKVHGPTWEQDLARAALIEDEGYHVVVITDADLTRRRDALHRRLARLLLADFA